MGNQQGEIWSYNNIDNNLSGTFTRLQNSFEDINTGWVSMPAIADINQDGFVEILVGNKRGGISLFGQSVLSTKKNSPKLSANNWQIFPNPTQNNLNIQFDIPIQENIRIEISNSLGQIVYQSEQWWSKNGTLDVSFLQEGIYFLAIYTTKKQYIKPFLKND